MRKIIIAIDGYSACGKSSTAKAVSHQLGYLYLDSGAMYRAVTLYFLRNAVDLNHEHDVINALDQINISFSRNNEGAFEILLNQENVEKEIRGLQVSDRVSDVSTLADVRKAMVKIQRQLAHQKGVVMDGRDIGTVVFPDAELKIFMTAEIDIRARRRQLELKNSGQHVDLETIKSNIIQRDKTDTNREISPLRKAEDAIEIDTTDLSLDTQIEMVVTLAKEKIAELA